MACKHERIKCVNCVKSCMICGEILPDDFFTKKKPKKEKPVEKPAEVPETPEQEAQAAEQEPKAEPKKETKPKAGKAAK